MFYGYTFYKTREDLFKSFSEGWTAQHVGRAPIAHTIRELTEGEREDMRNSGYKGVRTYYFVSNHNRGIPLINVTTSNWEDWAWVPKYEMNKYFDKTQYEAFINSLDVN